MAESKQPTPTGGPAEDPKLAPGDEPTGSTGLTGGDEITSPGADAGVTDGTRAAATGANLDETEDRGRFEVRDRSDR